MELDKDLVKLIAETAAKKAVDELRDELREDIRNEFKQHFGDQTAAEHMVQHERLNKFLAWMDKTSDRIWGRIINFLLTWGLAAAAIAYVASTKVGGTPT